ncbi:hypothetical protein M527_04550 [Sphingobium indicum IP26]|nr:MarR family transcriptional regulator [Sphingobium indicum]EPR10987.1 hypothetical protein M527_02665 [Sphingobium indicum IP26]EPR11357.1 hypothetical protein M527_04550 [Sphingobium indicum IP26]
MLAELGLTCPQYLVFLVLWKQAPQSVGSLGDMLHLDSGTLTPLLKRMEQAGLISRTRDPADERGVLTALTPAGRDLRAAAEQVPARLGAGLALGEEDVMELRDRVRALVDTLQHRDRGAPD